MSETVVRIHDDGKVMVERITDGISIFKQITPDALLGCINKSLQRGGVRSGPLPNGCLSYNSYDNGDKDIAMIHQADRADITYLNAEYKSFPLPRLAFGFHILKEGRVSSCRLGVVPNDSVLKPNTMMFHYPLSNVSGFNLCIGNNVLPKCNSPHTLGSLPYLIMAMPNNNDQFNHNLNKPGLEMRDLLELLKDKEPAYYYSHILKPNGSTLGEFINGRGW